MPLLLWKNNATALFLVSIFEKVVKIVIRPYSVIKEYENILAAENQLPIFQVTVFLTAVIVCAVVYICRIGNDDILKKCRQLVLAKAEAFGLIGIDFDSLSLIAVAGKLFLLKM